MEESKKVVAVVGAGLVGSLEACYLAKRGMEVHVYEYRQDIRTLEHVAGKSINLAMSVRGIEAMNGAGLGDHVKDEYGIPMYARMIHNRDGSTYPVPYGQKDQCIYSVGRRYVNEILIDAGEKFSNITYHFNHKLLKADLDKPQLTFQKKDGSTVIKNPDVIIGCDGAFSAVRREMLKRKNFDYEQKYISHAYMELCMPPDSTGDFSMPPNYLHIWPRGQFMMIGLPNQDKTFTITLFMPFSTFETITDSKSLLDFFQDNFQDSIPLLGKEQMIQDYFQNKALPLVSVKCNPYHVKDTSVILGDAAHAMVPFYGQGMNCGMEDVLVLDGILDKNGEDIKASFEEYSKIRNPDAEAIVDLALYNYIEMRDSVNRPAFLLRKKFDTLLNRLFPDWWVPLYTSVTFSRMRYHECISNKAWQDSMVTRMLKVMGVSVGVAGLAVLYMSSGIDLRLGAVAKTVLAEIPKINNIFNK